MSYKVFFVEDEIVTREGIRDNVDWKANGFEFCGEAPDGEIALPLLELAQPDVLITDIKMPFMDGLQLSQVVRERMPAAKIVILSGHDEFEYAQKAIKLGVTEYLLKPVSVQDMHNVLQKLAALITGEKRDQENLRRLREQVRESQAILREQFLRKLILGTVSSADAIDQSQTFGIDLVARYFMIVVLKVASDRPERFDYRHYEQIHRIASRVVADNPDVFLVELDWGEMALLVKGNTLEYLHEERQLLLERIERELRQTDGRLSIGVGAAKERITELYQSLIEALVNLQNGLCPDDPGAETQVDKADLSKIDKLAVENYLHSGVKEDFGRFFDTYIRPFGDMALRSPIVKNYVFVDMVLATAKFVHEMGGNVDLLMPDLSRLGSTLANIKTIEQIRAQAQDILVGALMFRDSRTSNQYAAMLRQAKEYLDRHYRDPNLSLNELAAQVSLSPCHFSAVFSQQTGRTFKEYLTELRIQKAKELLRTTVLRSIEIADQVGYNDPHYFSYVFRKITGSSPKEFRLQVQAN